MNKNGKFLLGTPGYGLCHQMCIRKKWNRLSLLKPILHNEYIDIFIWFVSSLQHYQGHHCVQYPPCPSEHGPAPCGGPGAHADAHHAPGLLQAGLPDLRHVGSLPGVGGILQVPALRQVEAERWSPRGGREKPRRNEPSILGGPLKMGRSPGLGLIKFLITFPVWS